MDGIDPATTILVIEAKFSAENNFDSLDNNRFVVLVPGEEPPEQRSDREEIPLVQAPKILYSLCFSTPAFDPALGWVFGSDAEDDCDIKLAKDRETGVSGHHFRINYNWTSMCLVLTNMSRHFTMMSSAMMGRDVLVRDSRVILSSEETTITAGMVSIVVWVPKRGKDQGDFDKNLAKFCQEAQAAIPKLSGLKLPDGSLETPLVVLGKRSRVQYVIENEGDIGRGSFGIVSRALDPTTGHLYAAKKFENTSETALKEMLLHEQISHEYIVRVFDVQEYPAPLLVMEYVKGGTLLEQQQLGNSQVITVLEQQLAALDYLHGLGIVHRDIKPANILIAYMSPQIITKLADFGFSTNKKRLKTFCGTEEYLAPEISPYGRQEYTSAVDIFSLGMVGVEYLYSFPCRPKHSQDWPTRLNRHLKSQSGPYKSILLRMLSTDAHKRPTAKICATFFAGQSSKAKIPSTRQTRTVRVVSATPGEVLDLFQQSRDLEENVRRLLCDNESGQKVKSPGAELEEISSSDSEAETVRLVSVGSST